MRLAVIGLGLFLVSCVLAAEPTTRPAPRAVYPYWGLYRCAVLVAETTKRFFGRDQHWVWRVTWSEIIADTPLVFLQRRSANVHIDYVKIASTLTVEQAQEIFSYVHNPNILYNLTENQNQLENRFGITRRRIYVTELDLRNNIRDGIRLLLAFDKIHHTSIGLDSLLNLVELDMFGPNTISLSEIVEAVIEHHDKESVRRLIFLLNGSTDFWETMETEMEYFSIGDFAKELASLLLAVRDQGKTPPQNRDLNAMLIRLISFCVERYGSDVLHQNDHRRNAERYLNDGIDYFRSLGFEATASQYQAALTVFETYQREDFFRAMSSAFQRRGLGAIPELPNEYPNFAAFYRKYLDVMIELDPRG